MPYAYTKYAAFNYTISILNDANARLSGVWQLPPPSEIDFGAQIRSVWNANLKRMNSLFHKSNVFKYSDIQHHDGDDDSKNDNNNNNGGGGVNNGSGGSEGGKEFIICYKKWISSLRSLVVHFGLKNEESLFTSSSPKVVEAVEYANSQSAANYYHQSKIQGSNGEDGGGDFRCMSSLKPKLQKLISESLFHALFYEFVVSRCEN